MILLYLSVNIFEFQNGRISSMDFHKATNYLVTASDDESIRLYDVQNAMYVLSESFSFSMMSYSSKK